MLLNHNLSIEEASGENHHIFHVSAVFILGVEGLILFSYFNQDYRVRLNGEILLKAAEHYTNQAKTK